MPHELATTNNPYEWWRDRRVDYRADDGQWLPGVVIDAVRDRDGPLQDGNRADDVLGIVDGILRVKLLDGPTVRTEIYPGGPLGIIPRVVLTAPIGPKINDWWNDLSPTCQDALIRNPGGPVAARWLSEVSAKGATVSGAFFPAVQPGPDGLHLGRPFRDIVVDAGLRRTFLRAQAELDRVITESAGVDPFTAPEIRARDRAKIAWDEWRGELAERNA